MSCELHVEAVRLNYENSNSRLSDVWCIEPTIGIYFLKIINILTLAFANNIKDVEKQRHYNIDVLSTSFAILLAVVLSLETRYWYICTDFTLRLYGAYDYVGLYILCPDHFIICSYAS